MIYILMGPQGSGKGTEAKKLSNELGLEHVSIGDLIRKEISSESATGKIIKEYVEKGELIPKEINNKIVKDVLEKNKDVILDGYPRNKDQAEFLLNTTKIECVILINISEEESIKRLSKRVICTANNKILIEDKMTQEDIDECKKLGGEIMKRSDDKPEAIKKRLNIYHKETKPVISYFKEKNIKVIEIDGENSVKNVFGEIKEKLKSEGII